MLRLIKVVLLLIAPFIMFFGVMYFINGRDVSFYAVVQEFSKLELGKDEMKYIIQISDLWENLFIAVGKFSTPVFDFSSGFKALASIGGMLINIAEMIKTFFEVIIHGFQTIILLLLVSIRDVALVLRTFFSMFIQ